MFSPMQDKIFPHPSNVLAAAIEKERLAFSEGQLGLQFLGVQCFNAYPGYFDEMVVRGAGVFRTVDTAI